MDETYQYDGIVDMQEYSKDLGTEFRMMEGYMRQGDKAKYLRSYREASNILDKLKNKLLFIPTDESDFWGEE